MTDILKLILQARNLAKQRGHKIGKFVMTQIETGYPTISSRGCMVGICECCGATVAVASSPPPGIPEIFGDALEKDCPGEVFI